MSWFDVAKVALALYLAASVGYFVVVYRRRVRSRSPERPVRPDDNPFYTRRWAVAATPLPEWAYEEDAEPVSPEADGQRPGR